MEKAIRVQSMVGTAAMVWILKEEVEDKWIQVAIVTGMAKAHTFDRATSDRILSTIDGVIHGTVDRETLTLDDDFTLSTGSDMFSIRRNLYRGINDSFTIDREALIQMIQQRDEYLIVTHVH